jgi:hypothetical protein
LRRIDNIGNEGSQTHTIPLADGDIILDIRFLSSVQFWQMSVTYNGKTINGVKMSCGVLHMRSVNFPFDFIVTDESGAGVDPYKVDDFSNSRNLVYLLDSDEMEAIRGQEVN